MHLSLAINKAMSVSDFNDIFDENVTVKLGWMNDQVEVAGYQGVVTTDFIAHSLMKLGDKDTDDSNHLATSLAKKVFIPLRKLVEAPENHCSLYQFFALSRVSWTPPPSNEFGRSIALKHAMVLGHLHSKYANF